FFSKEMVETLEALGVRYVLKVPDWPWVRARLGCFRRSARHTSSRETLWTTRTKLYGARLFSLERRRPLRADSGELALETYAVTRRAHVLTTPSPNWSGHLGAALLTLFEEEANGGISQ